MKIKTIDEYNSAENILSFAMNLEIEQGSFLQKHLIKLMKKADKYKRVKLIQLMKAENK